MTYSNLNQRVITAVIMIAFVAALMIWSAGYCTGRIFMVLAGFIVVAFCSFEFAGICATDTSRGMKMPVYFTLGVLPSFVLLWLVSQSGLCGVPGEELKNYLITSLLTCGLSFAGALLFVNLKTKRSLDDSAGIAGEIFLGVLFTAFCGTALLNLLLMESSHTLLLWLLLVVCVNDTAAYFVGSKVKGPRIAPVISPNKTVSGSVAGLAGGLLMGCVFSFLLPFSPGFVSAACGALLVTVAAQAGDLGKSYIKRLYGVKDSGTILPGHGGFLDRADGVICGAPVMLFWIYFTLSSH